MLPVWLFADALFAQVDVLTGETVVLRTDILYDCGNSLNPAIDLGQAEGAFVTGLGFVLREEVRRDGDGRLLTDGTWTYKPPLASDIPHVLNVGLLHGAHSAQPTSLVLHSVAESDLASR